MSAIAEGTCANPTRWRWISKQCSCAGCKQKEREYHQMHYRKSTEPPAPPTPEEVAKREAARAEMVRLGKATYCPICLEWTSSKSGFCTRHEDEEAR